MSWRSSFYLVFALCVFLFAGAGGGNRLTKVNKVPEGVAPSIAATLAAEGLGIESSEGTVCELWMGKALPLKPAFKPTSNVKYPFQSGELIGVLRVGDKVEFTDFRGQPIKPGVYTLRYGQQPQDGNHLGTSEVADFLLAIPAASDTDPKPLAPLEHLHKASAKSAGSNHPAILSLLPAESSVKAASLTQDDNKRWVLGVPLSGSDQGKQVPVSLRLIVIGKAEG